MTFSTYKREEPRTIGSIREPILAECCVWWVLHAVVGRLQLAPSRCGYSYEHVRVSSPCRANGIEKKWNNRTTKTQKCYFIYYYIHTDCISSSRHSCLNWSNRPVSLILLKKASEIDLLSRLEGCEVEGSVLIVGLSI